MVFYIWTIFLEDIDENKCISKSYLCKKIYKINIIGDVRKGFIFGIYIVCFTAKYFLRHSKVS